MFDDGTWWPFEVAIHITTSEFSSHRTVRFVVDHDAWILLCVALTILFDMIEMHKRVGYEMNEKKSSRGFWNGVFFSVWKIDGIFEMTSERNSLIKTLFFVNVQISSFFDGRIRFYILSIIRRTMPPKKGAAAKATTEIETDSKQVRRDTMKIKTKFKLNWFVFFRKKSMKKINNPSRLNNPVQRRKQLRKMLDHERNPKQKNCKKKHPV